MDTNRLRYFHVFSRTCHLRRASELLRITPSALSKAIHQLEEELRVPLVVPAGRGLLLSEAGQKLASRAAQILDSLDGLADELRDDQERGATSRLRIATFEVFSTYFLSVLEETRWKPRPLVLQEVLPGELERAVAEGRVDYGISYLPIPYPGCEMVKICDIEMGVFARVGAFRDVPQMQLPFVVPALPLSGAPSRVRGLDGWPEDAYDRKVAFEVTLLESALELCRQGLCAGYFPVFLVERHNLKYRPRYHLERRPSPYRNRKCRADVYLVRRANQPEDPTMREIARLIRIGCRHRVLGN